MLIQPHYGFLGVRHDVITDDHKPPPGDQPECRRCRCGGRRGHQAGDTELRTTLNYARHIPQWQERGYHVTLIFLSLPSADLAVARARNRVRQGGHDIPKPAIRRRLDAGLKNFNAIYRQLVDSWALYDSPGRVPQLLTAGDKP